MPKAVFAAALAVGCGCRNSFRLPPRSRRQLRPTRMPKRNKEQSGRQLAARERQKKCAAEWKGSESRQQGRDGSDVAKILE
jgi:hypothetical protein